MVLALILGALAIAAIPAQATSPMVYSLVFRTDGIPLDGVQEKVTLDDAHKAHLDAIVADFRKAGAMADSGKAGYMVTIDGRCDACRGTARQRNEMSRRFAEAVADYLVIIGVPDSAITTSWDDDQYDITPAGDGSPTEQFVMVVIGVF